MSFWKKDTNYTTWCEKEKEIAVFCGQFLIDLGYKAEVYDYSVDFKKDGKCISVAFERYNKWVDFFIVFDGDRKIYNVRNIAFVRDSIYSDPEEVMNTIILIMEYIKNNFEKITNYKYCKDSDKLM
ncbi:MAG: hypothetical protein E7235_05595 [Lachnospiraceae bacterium]|nr:hypothetical protein [Lachnospiraceae bacterium]